MGSPRIYLAVAVTAIAVAAIVSYAAIAPMTAQWWNVPLAVALGFAVHGTTLAAFGGFETPRR